MSEEIPGILFIAGSKNSHGEMVNRHLKFFPGSTGDCVTPLYRKWRKETLEEMQPWEVNIRIRDGNRLIFHCHYKHMRIGKANIILEYQLIPGPCCDGSKTGVTEFERGCTVETGHKGSHHLTIRIYEKIAECTIDIFVRDLRLQ